MNVVLLDRAFGADSMVDAGSMTATYVVVEPEGATVPTGETDTPDGEVPDGEAELAPVPGPDEGPVEKPAVTTNATVIKTTVSKPV